MFASQLPTSATSFVGRAEELASIKNLLADPRCRLLTIVGPGGMGKTRLALQAAEQQLPCFEHGVYFVPLTPIGSPDLIAYAIITALQIPASSSEDPAVQLVRTLRAQRMLFVLDGFEHLLAGSDLLTQVLEAAPGVKFLVTSRERLNLEEEWGLVLEGLAVPDGQPSEPLERYSAVELFVQRARQVQTHFSLRDHAEAVETICQWVEGMPLGLELAASWLRAMSCQQIVAQMGSLDFLTTPLRNIPERHRSLRAIFEQSWRMLSADEQNVLMQLSVFRGGFDLQSAGQVAGATLPILVSLADKSLIRFHPSGRYDLQELLRQYAADKLSGDEARATAHRHLDYFLELTEQAEAHQYGSEQPVWLDRLEVDLDNVRAALSWSLEGGVAERGLMLTSALRSFWEFRGHQREGAATTKQLLAVAQDASPSIRAQALLNVGELVRDAVSENERATAIREALAIARLIDDRATIARSLSALAFFTSKLDTPEADALLEESLSLYREIDDPYGLSHALRRRAWAANLRGDYAYAVALLEEALTCARAVGDQTAMAWSLMMLGYNYICLGHEFSASAPQFEESVTLLRELNDASGAQWPLSYLGRIEQMAGNATRAQTLYCEALTCMRKALDYAPCMIGLCMAGLGALLEGRGEPDRAAHLLGAVVRREEYFDYRFFEAAALQSLMASVRAQLGDAAFEGAFAEGQVMTDEQAVAYTLEQLALPEEMAPTTTFTRPLVEPLSARELEVLRLLADGLSNREIAQKLVISVATVKVHTGNIYGKLGVANRTQAVGQAQKLKLL